MSQRDDVGERASHLGDDAVAHIGHVEFMGIIEK
jgi:hypothetical protein